MKTCPQCQSQYTDPTLKYCLQDGAVLADEADSKTEILDSDVFAQMETVAVNASETDVIAGQTNATQPRSAQVHSQPTIERPRAKSGTGFWKGLIAGILVLGALIAVGLGAWLLPGFIGKNDNTNTNTNRTVAEKKPVTVTRDMVEKISASSTRKPYKGILYITNYVMDENGTTGWCEGASGPGRGEWIRVDFKETLELKEFTIKPGYFKNATIWKKNNRVASVRLQFSNGQNRIFDFPDVMKPQTLDLTGVETSFVKFSINEVYLGTTDYADTLISEIGFVALK